MSLFGEEVESSIEFDPLTGQKQAELPQIKIYANSHYVTPRGRRWKQAINSIKDELKERLDWLVANGKLLEAQRLEQRTRFDLEMMEATGSCAGIENYSRYLTGRLPGASRRRPSSNTHPRQRPAVRRREPQDHPADQPPMYKGDRSRKLDPGRIRLPPTLVHGQPAAEVRGVGRDAAADRQRLGHPGSTWELEKSGGVFAEQIVRPTGLIDFRRWRSAR